MLSFSVVQVSIGPLEFIQLTSAENAENSCESLLVLLVLLLKGRMSSYLQRLSALPVL